MVSIRSSVGNSGVNRREDVKIIQTLLNHYRESLPRQRALSVDGLIGPATIDAISDFQKTVVGMRRPDGRVDPGGTTLARLNEQTRSQSEASSRSREQPQAPTSASPRERSQTVASTGLQFPLRKQPRRDYMSGGREYGGERNGRRHAGCDLLTDEGTEILAMADGVVIQDAYAFYSGTFALEVDHGDFTVRYGEISKAGPGIRKGVRVKKGQVVGYVGRLNGSRLSMLHLEMYKGTERGPLTVRDNPPFRRRADLMDPTPFLDESVA